MLCPCLSGREANVLLVLGFCTLGLLATGWVTLSLRGLLTVGQSTRLEVLHTVPVATVALLIFFPQPPPADTNVQMSK